MIKKTKIDLTSHFKFLKISLFLILVVFLFSSHELLSQPSGGPYGPIHLTYEIPETNSKIIFVSPNGKKDNSGANIDLPTTIENAFENVQSGDVIIFRGGVYRTGNLMFNQKITMQPYKDERPILKGTVVAEKWTDLGNGLWRTNWNILFPSKPEDWWRRHREGKKTPQHRFNNDMVFVNGNFLQSAGWEGEVDENSFFIDYENNHIYIGTDPTNKRVEITAYNSALIRTTKNIRGIESDKLGPEINGITFTQYAYRALEIEGTEPEGLSKESEHGKDVVGTKIENCEISFCSRVAAYIRGDSLVIKNCKISDTSTEGLYIIASADVLLERNIFLRNNIENITGYYPAAVKIFNQTYRVTCNDNVVMDQPNSNGIWYDVGNVDGVFTNNYIDGVGCSEYETRYDQVWPSRNGFFFEISKGAVCAGNVFVNSDHGVMILNSSDVKMFNNTFYNSTAVVGRNERSAAGDHFGWHPSTGPDVDERTGHEFYNNLLVGDEDFENPLLFLWQSEKICNDIKSDQLTVLNSNGYVIQHEKKNYIPIIFSPFDNENCQIKISSLDQINKLHFNFSSKSKYKSNYSGSIFKSIELKNFELDSNFNYSNIGNTIKENDSKYFNNNVNGIGAFPND